MGCRCGNKANRPSGGNYTSGFTVMGNYKYLNPQQIAKRLEMFKRLNCKKCENRYICDFDMYNQCGIKSGGK